MALSAWSFSVTKQRNFEYYDIKYSITNGYTKGIKLIEGSIQFYDLLGELIYGIALDKDKSLEPSKVTSDSGLFQINPYINREGRMKSIKKEDIVAKLKIRKIVFEDNTVIDFTQ